jgi:hypothetical protein
MKFEHNWLEGSPAKLVEYDSVRIGEMLDYAEQRLIDSSAPVFQTGGRVVHPVRLDQADPQTEAIRRPAGALLVRNVAPMRVREYLTECCAFFIMTRWGAKRIPAPMELVNHLLAREDKWRLPVLAGIIETPTLRKDGSLLQSEGYDDASGLWLDFNGAMFPSIREEPNKRDAVSAIGVLKELIKGFPFVETTKHESPSRAVALSAILTALVRRSLHSAPLHASSAPTPGTGKTLLWDMVGRIATGRPLAAISQGRTQEEDEKRIFTVLLEGAPVVLIDNVAHPIGGEAICTVLTEPFYRGRILGESRSAQVATNALWLATGNNLTFNGDITRRVIMAKMDAKMEHPEIRKFDVDLKEYVAMHRGQLVHAGLTILRAHLAAECPGANGLDSFGSFDQWNDWVRGALLWLGEADPCRTRKFIEADDPEREAAATLFRAIYDDRGEEWFKVKDLCCDEVELCSDDTLWTAIQAVVPPKAETRRALGRYLKAQSSRIYGGLHLRQSEDRHDKTLKFQISTVRG